MKITYAAFFFVHIFFTNLILKHINIIILYFYEKKMFLMNFIHLTMCRTVACCLYYFYYVIIKIIIIMCHIFIFRYVALVSLWFMFKSTDLMCFCFLKNKYYIQFTKIVRDQVRDTKGGR